MPSLARRNRRVEGQFDGHRLVEIHNPRKRLTVNAFPG
jgi:hypothetical protein